MYWVMHLTGLDSASGPAYLFWSGIGGNLGIIAVLYGVLRKHNCHVRGCLRIGIYHVGGTPYVVCRRHHPDVDAAPAPQDLHA